MSILMQNGILQAAEQKIESQLTPANRDDYMKIVVAGMKTALHKGPNGGFAALRNSKNPVQQCVTGAINLCMMMRIHATGTMPVKALVPAAMTLMLKALDFLDKTGVVKVDNAVLVQATHLFTNEIFRRFHLTAQMLHTAAAKVHGIIQDPAAMAKVNARAGLIKAPNAASNANSAVKAPPPPPAPAPLASAGGSNGAS
jgi:hypothetical protein